MNDLEQINKLSTSGALTERLNAIMDKPPRFATVFIKPKSDNWPLVKSFCQKYAVTVDEYAPGLVATWSGADCEMRALSEIIRLASDWRGFFFFSFGELCKGYEVYTWISCYARSMRAGDRTFYCIKDYLLGEYHLTMPCRMLYIDDISHSFRRYFFDANIVQALAVRQGLINCPNFQLDNFFSKKDGRKNQKWWSWSN